MDTDNQCGKKEQHEAYRNPQAWSGLVQNAMNAHFTWDISADEYINLYNKVKYRKY